jgi:hypothetical protein
MPTAVREGRDGYRDLLRPLWESLDKLGMTVSGNDRVSLLIPTPRHDVL